MAYQMNNQQGSLFTNQYKNTQDPNDRSPHLKGRCVINGQEWAIAGWWAYPQNGGQPYLQLKFEIPQQRQQGGYQGQPQQGYQPQPGYQPQQGYPQQQGYQQPQQPQYQQPAQPQQPQYQQPAQPQYQPAAQPGYQPQPGYPPQGGQPVDDLPFAGPQQ